MSGQDHKGQEPVNPRIFPLPPVVLLLFLAAGFGLQYVFPVFNSEPPGTESIIAGNGLMVLAFLIAVLAAREMGRARTAIHPGSSAKALVRSGPFQRSRNPIYLSFIVFMLGLGIAMANPWLILLAPLLLLYLQERVIKREEAYLTARFGPEYIAYRNRVRRWF